MARKKNEWRSERCLSCAHPQIGEINFAICKGVPILAIAKKYNLTAASLYSHARNHIPDNYRKIISAGIYADIDDLLKKCTTGDAQTLDLLDAAISGTFNAWSLAFANGSQAGMTAHGSQLRQFLELRSKINRELVPNPGSVTNNILLSGDVSSLLRILQPFPEAKQAIVNHFAARPAPMIEHHAGADD